jgi:NAD(P)-dependent dehydrogenase (short-subunit alcohol dehydrogenase family)
MPLETLRMSPSASKIWLITGCSAGFGYALARAVQAHGHKVIASSRNPPKSSDLVKEITDKGGHWIPLDVTAKDVKQTIEKAEAIYGHLDVAVNNAGYSYVGAIEDLE